MVINSIYFFEACNNTRMSQTNDFILFLEVFLHAFTDDQSRRFPGIQNENFFKLTTENAVLDTII